MGNGLFSREAWRNYLAFALLAFCLAGVHLVLAANPGAARSVAQTAVFQWAALAIICGLGFLGTVFLNLTPLRGLWDRDLTLHEKAAVPLTLGALLGAADLAADMYTHLSRLIASEMHLPSIHIAFPLSIPIYFGGAILVSIVYFFVLLPLLYWAIAVKWLKGRGEAAVYWTLGGLLALIEPLTQGDLQEIAKYGAIAAPGAIADLILNLGQVWFLRRSGLVAAILFRVGYYAVWHVLYGAIPA